MVDETMHFRAILDQLASTGEVFSMEETAARLIFDVIARVVFNLSLHAQTQGSHDLKDLQSLIRLSKAQFSWDPILKTKAFFERKLVLRRLHASMETKIKERLDLLRSEKVVPSKKDPYSILDLMLREQLQQETQPSKAEKMPEDLAPEFLELLLTKIKGLLLGGHGTTTQTLCFIYMLMSKHPSVLQKLREEHSTIFHPEFSETINILHEFPHKLGDLEYMNVVIQETLRLFPVGFGVREAADIDASITHNGWTYPIGNHLAVVATAHTLHYDPGYYSDPAQFQPERFLSTNQGVDDDSDDENNAKSDIPRSHFRTFGRGPRACLGQNLAQDELRVILLMTVRDYDFECANLKPDPPPGRAMYTELDTVFGDVVFQELGIEAKARGKVEMRVSKRKW